LPDFRNITLGRIQIVNYLNIKSYDRHNDGCHYFPLTEMSSNRELFSVYIDRFNKNDRMLNLNEAHSLICKEKDQNITHSHDPLTDVINTCYIFNYLIKLMKPSTIYRYCNKLVKKKLLILNLTK
jgi:hypothetical protein